MSFLCSLQESLTDAPEVVPSDLTSELESDVATPNENTHIPVTSDRSNILAAMRRAMSAGVTPNNHLVPDNTDELVRQWGAVEGFFCETKMYFVMELI